MLALPWNTRVLKCLAFDVSERSGSTREVSKEQCLIDSKKQQALKAFKTCYRTFIIVILLVGGTLTSLHSAFTNKGVAIKLAVSGMATYFTVLAVEIICVKRNITRM